MDGINGTYIFEHYNRTNQTLHKTIMAKYLQFQMYYDNLKPYQYQMVNTTLET